MRSIAIDTERNLSINGETLLADVPENVSLTHNSANGVFLGATSSESSSRHVFPVGQLRGHRFTCCFRFKLWWLAQWMGTSGREVPTETQFMLVELRSRPSTHATGTANGDLDSEQNTLYVVFLPLLEGPFRACLQGKLENDQLELCLESGDVSVKSTGGTHCVSIHYGTNPFQIISEAVKTAELQLQTFRRREEKQIPGFLDWFGWCTWDAFYTKVSADGVRKGLKSLEEGGIPAKFIIIDDGWQSVSINEQNDRRLTDIRENFKFRKNVKEGAKRPEDPALGIQHLVQEIKANHKLKYVYIWHTITGYWGGIHPDAAEMKQYKATVHPLLPSQGVLNNQPDLAEDQLITNGIGLPHPDKVSDFFHNLHSCLATAGVDGVKVDNQNILETLGTGFGGRVSITQHYQQALESSISKNFPDNGIIACMSHNTDGLYSIRNTSVIRASDDFFPRDSASHTIHVAAVAYNSMFLGEFMQPDWDMFHSKHPAAEYHAAARAIGGCPIYVSDEPGEHDFKLLRKLVLPDGSILRAKLPGRPCRDSLFTDPTRDGKSLLKIWNMNKYTGVVGVFNCQGAGWNKVEKKMMKLDNSSSSTSSITGTVYPRDVDSLCKTVCSSDQQSDGTCMSGECAIYSHRSGELVCLKSWNTGISITLNVLEYEIFTVSPIKKLSCGAAFAPIGLLDMLNSGGAIREYEYGQQVRLQIHGCGFFGAYSSQKPKECYVNSNQSSFSYNDSACLLKVCLPEDHDLCHEVSFTFST